MSKRPIYPVVAAVAGAGLAYVLAQEASRRALTHRNESRLSRDRYVRGFPVRRRYVSVLGCNTHVYEAVPEASTQPPLLLIHGGVIEGASWMEAVSETPQPGSALATDRRVLIPDLPAHGASGYLSPHKLMSWLEAFVDSEIGPRPFDLCGHSMGGGLALYYAARHPDRIRKLVLCAPAGTGQVLPRAWPEPWNSGLFNLWPLHDSLIEKVWGDPSTITAEQRQQFGLVFRDFFYSSRWWWYLSGGVQWLFDIPRETLRAIKSPALLIWGEKDRVVPFNGQRTVQRVQQIPNARVLFLDGLGHLPQVESPEAFNTALQGFLNA